jgi:hypothetical protein
MSNTLESIFEYTDAEIRKFINAYAKIEDLRYIMALLLQKNNFLTESDQKYVNDSQFRTTLQSSVNADELRTKLDWVELN